MAFTPDPDGTRRYRAACTWSGSTGAGYDAYALTHRGEAPPATAALALSNDPSLGGDATLLDPEQLVLAAVMSHDERPARIGASVHRVERLVHLAHDECYVANSLASPVTVEPVVQFSP